MNKTKKIINSIFTVLVFNILVLTMSNIFLTPVTVEAKAQSLFDNDKKQSLIVWLEYEKNDISVKFIDPKGKKIDPLANDGKTTTFTSEHCMYVVIHDAREGEWKIDCNKGSNDTVKVSVQVYEEPLWITEFSHGKVTDAEMNVKFMAEHKEDIGYDYEIYLVTEKNGPGREIASGYANANEQEEVTIDFSEINSYDNYYLKLYAHYNVGENEYFDQVFSEAFSYTNPYDEEGIENYYAQIEYYKNQVTFDWSGMTPWGAKGAWLKVNADDEEVFNSYVSSDEGNKTSISIPKLREVETIKASLSIGLSNGRITSATEKIINLKNDGKNFYMDFPEVYATNAATYTISYANTSQSEVSFTFNEEEITEVLDGSGQKSFALTDGENVVSAYYNDEENMVAYYYYSRIILDNTPPSLNLFEEYDGINTEDSSIIIIGQTDEGAIVTINDNEVEVKEDKTFSYEQSLELGKNSITVSACDDVGNMISYELVVNRKNKEVPMIDIDTDNSTIAGVLSWLPAIIALVGSILCIIFLFICLSIKKRNKGFAASIRILTPFFAVISLISSIASLVIFILRYKYEHSKEFIEYVYKEPGDANKYLDNTIMVRNIAIISIILTISLIALFIWLMKIKNRPPKEKKAKPVKQTKTVVSGQQAQVKFCPKCGAPLEENVIFCGKCGTRL